ncbi:fimbrial chaperone protein [Bosea sp. OK403]|uniref:fimbrial biogenesis chaperone n=1 Tax=Bosea sp. OK403 TaxID=1855286 RepID=UPI0008DFD544|nr:molecular chaperone [Bosea sp. OK403]SFH96010.1 fimbrial chaperone protein [Bosea sp. OK403]
MKTMSALVVLAASLAGQASAASLQVAPVLLDLPAPATTATITLRNTDVEPITAQLRIFRWIQDNGVERLEPTNDVVASPPLVDLRSRQDYTVRVIRVASRPPDKEEAYRLVIDELPKPKRASGTVALVTRHLVPVFFTGKSASPPAISWSAGQHGRGITLAAVNSGDTRVRLAAVTLRDASGQVLSASKGLLGYSLGRSSMRWDIAAPARPTKSGASVTISGMTETGPFNATFPVQTAR